MEGYSRNAAYANLRSAVTSNRSYDGNMRREINNKDLALRVKGHLYEIEQVNDNIIGGQQGWPMAEEGYKTTLLNVADCADKQAVDEVADYIKRYIRDYEDRPANRKVRRKARAIVSDQGYPATSYLNKA